jgi:heme oxygenase
MEITTSWMEQGQESATRGLVVKQLTRKLGNLSPELLAKVSSLNLDRVEALAEDLLDFNSVGDLERWLAV